MDADPLRIPLTDKNIPRYIMNKAKCTEVI